MNPLDLSAKRLSIPWRALGWMALAVVALGYLAMQREAGPQGYWLPKKALFLALLSLTPALLFAWRTQHQGMESRAVPLIPIVSAIYGLYFALPVLSSDVVIGMRIEPDLRALEQALDLALGGFLCFLLGARWIGRRAWPRALQWNLDPRRSLQAALILLPLGLVSSGLLRSGELPAIWIQPAKLLSLGLQLSVGLLLLLARQGALPRASHLLLWCLALPALLAIEISAGQVGSALRLGCFVLALIWASGGRVPMLAILAGAALALLLRSGAAEYRYVMRHYPHLLPDSRFERALVFAQLVKEQVQDDRQGKSLAAINDRLAQIALFAHVTDLTPLSVPYWNGATYASLPATLIPRALWPDKPVQKLGQAFGHRYGILAPDDQTTSINLPQVVELYANFGRPGVWLGMLALGVLYGALARLLCAANVGSGTALLGALMMGSLTNIESDLAMMLGTAMQQALLVGAVLLWICRAKAEGRGTQSLRMLQPLRLLSRP